MIVYKFEGAFKNFNASVGYARIEVANGLLTLEQEPDPDTLALILKHDGKRVEEEAPSKPKSKPKATKKDGES